LYLKIRLEAISKLLPAQKKRIAKRSQGNFSSHSSAYGEQKLTKNSLDKRFFCLASNFEMASFPPRPESH